MARSDCGQDPECGRIGRNALVFWSFGRERQQIDGARPARSGRLCVATRAIITEGVKGIIPLVCVILACYTLKLSAVTHSQVNDEATRFLFHGAKLGSPTSGGK